MSTDHDEVVPPSYLFYALLGYVIAVVTFAAFIPNANSLPELMTYVAAYIFGVNYAAYNTFVIFLPAFIATKPKAIISTLIAASLFSGILIISKMAFDGVIGENLAKTSHSHAMPQKL